MRSNIYTDIVSMFFMDDKPNTRFDPQCIDFKEIVRYALGKAFNDFNFRTLTKTKTFTADYDAWAVLKNEIRKQQPRGKKDAEPKMTDYLSNRLDTCAFLDRFVAYFLSPAPDQAAFDVWHHDTCQLFLDVLNGDGSFAGYTQAYVSLAYGKAQKIVNMMFKHLYCQDGAEHYGDHFKHCHMVLDNFTLEWFKRTLDEKRIDSWSNLVYRKPSVDQQDYLYYQEKIRDYFLPFNTKTHTYANLTPFQAEFYIWPEIQWLLAAEALTNQNLVNDAKRRGYKITDDATIAEKCDALLCQLTDLRSLYI